MFGMFRQRVGELLSCLNVLLDPQQHKLERGVFGLVGDILDGSANRNSGTNHHRQLAGEVENVAGIGPGRLIECLEFLAQRLALGADERQGPVESIWVFTNGRAIAGSFWDASDIGPARHPWKKGSANELCTFPPMPYPGAFQEKNERSFLCCGHELKALSLGLHLRKPGLNEL